MSPHQLGYYALLATQNGGMKIADPGDGLTFHLDKSGGVAVLVSGSGAETRVLPTPSASNGIGVGTRLIVTLGTDGGGDVTITDSTSSSYVLTGAGDAVEFLVVQSTTTPIWVGRTVLTGLTSAVGELNILDGVTATGAELNASSDMSGRILTSTATTVALGVATHGGRVLMLQGTANSTYTYTLPLAAGTGAVFTLIVAPASSLSVTQGTHIITVTTTDTLRGALGGFHTTSTAGGVGWITTNGTSITLNHGTKGGILGDKIELIDEATGYYRLSGVTMGSGTLATPIS